MRESACTAVEVAAGERLLGEVVADALRDLIGDRGSVLLVDRSTNPAERRGVVIDLENVDISITIERDDGSAHRGATWMSAKVVSLDEVVRLARSGAGAGASTTAHPTEVRERKYARHGPVAGRLTDRELEVLGEMRRGAANTTIAASLDISVHTVRSHVGSIMRKLGTNTRVEAITRSS